jgi:ABC-type spermidine/putrescine transport system permease subunit II
MTWGPTCGTIATRIVIPHAMPGIVSGSIVVFMLTLGNYLTPNLMGGKNSLWFTEQIYNQFIASFNWNQGAAFGFLLLALSSLIIWVGLKLTRQKLTERWSNDSLAAQQPDATLYWASSSIWGCILSFYVRAAAGDLCPGLQRLPVSGAALERLHPGLVCWRSAGAGGHLPRFASTWISHLGQLSRWPFGSPILSTTVGTCAAFLFEQEDFPFKQALYFLMLAPLVIPGVILGISILLFSNTLGIFFEDPWGNLDVPLFRPGFWLVVLGQFSFIATLVTLVVSARLKKFDRTLEEAALNLGANRFEVIWHITLLFYGQPLSVPLPWPFSCPLRTSTPPCFWWAPRPPCRSTSTFRCVTAARRSSMPSPFY